MPPARWFASMVLALAAVACSSVGGYQAQDDGVTVPHDAEAAVQAARSDVQARTGSAESPEMLSLEVMDWPDSSLGCPEPDRMYAQVITPGYRIVLLLGDAGYVYHMAGSRAVYCPRDEGASSPVRVPAH